MKFKSDQTPMCLFCTKGKPLPGTEDVLCTLRGIVSQDYCCKKYEYNILTRKPRRKRELNTDKFSPEDFEI